MMQKDRDAKRKLERLKARKAGAQAQTSTSKKTGRKQGQILDETIDITSPEKSPKKNGSKTDGEKLETKKRTRDKVDTNYSTDDDVIPSECDDEAKIVIHRKNKKINMTKKLLKGGEARIKCLKQKVKDQEEELKKLKTKANDVEGKAKTLAEQESDQLTREQILVEKESEMEDRSNEVEREREKLAKKAESVKKSVLQQIPNNWMTREGHTLKTALEQTITSIIESEDEDMNVNEESGINTGHTVLHRHNPLSPKPSTRAPRALIKSAKTGQPTLSLHYGDNQLSLQP